MKGVLEDYDVVILLGLIQSRDVAVEIAVQADTSLDKSLYRAEKAGLYSLLRQKVQRHAFYEFLTSGLKYIFPVDLEKPLCKGLGTSASGPPLRARMCIGVGAEMVWYDPDGNLLGRPVTPLHPAATILARHYPFLHEWMSLTDALRCGRARERNLAAQLLKEEWDL